MIRKILIAEDYASYNLSIQKVLEDLDISNPDYVYYCDDALIRIQKAKDAGASYDLLITDLHFDEDSSRKSNISDGEALITAVQKVQPDLKVLVFSVTGRSETIEKLYQQGIDGYVSKGRNDTQKLKQAVEQISHGQRYFPQQQVMQMRKKINYNFDEVDLAVINCIASGYSQKTIPHYLKQHNMKPSGLSSIEKKLSQMREAHGFTSNTQLVSYCIENGIIDYPVK